MTRYIDADEFLKSMIAKFKCVPLLGVVGCNRWGEEFVEGEHLDALINTTSTADVVEVKHGEWATDEEDIKWGNALKRKHCSVCQKRPLFDKEEREFVLTKFCPNCGAKMDGGKKK